MDLLNNLLETYTALTRRVENLEQDKIAQALEIIKLKKRVRKLEKKKKLKVFELKRLQKIEQNEAYARELETELNKNINWDDVIEQVKEKGKLDNDVLRNQALKRKPQTKAQARKNMMKKTKEELEEDESKTLKRKTESSEEKAVKKQKLDEEVEELNKHLQIVPNDDDDVYTEATPFALKVPVVDYEIYTENNKPYYKIIRAGGSHQLFLSFLSLLKNFDREDLEMLWQIVQEIFASSKSKKDTNQSRVWIHPLQRSSWLNKKKLDV
nr:hypothetical protein [Tanacetum cinerariifolium]